MADIHDIVNSQFPPHIKEQYPVFCRFVEEYYRWLSHRQLGDLSDITDIDHLTRMVEIFENNLPLSFYIGQTLVGNTSGTKATVLSTYEDKLLIRYITKDSHFISGEEVHLRRNLSDSVATDHARISAVLTVPSVFIDHFSNMLDTYHLFDKNQPAIALILKNIKQLYLSKGTEQALIYLLKASMNVDAQVAYPIENVLRPSDGKWKQLTAVTLKTIAGEVPTDMAIESLRFMSIANQPYVDYTVEKIEPLVTDKLTRFYFTFDPNAYEGQIVEYFMNDQVIYAGKVVKGQAGLKVLDGGENWQVGQVFKIGGKDGWSIYDFSYDQERRPWYTRDFQFPENDYGEHGIIVTPQQEEKSTICRVSVIDDKGVMKYAEIIQLGEHIFESENPQDNQFTVSPLFFQTGDESERKYDATLEFTFDYNATLPGRWEDDSGMISNQDIRLQDSYYYQQFSYDIMSNVNPDEYETLAKALHPAGTKMFTTYIMDANLSLKNRLSVDVSTPYVSLSFFDVAFILDSVVKHFIKQRYDTTTNVDNAWKYFAKGLIDHIISTDTRMEFKYAKTLFDDVISTDTSLTVKHTKEKTDNAIVTDFHDFSVDKSIKEDLIISESLKLSFTKTLESVSDSDDGTPHTPSIKDVAYDTNSEPYYERIFHPTTHANLSYGAVGNNIMLEII